jgi:nitrogen regulatory protein PII
MEGGGNESLMEECIVSGELAMSASEVEGRGTEGRMAKRPREMEASQFLRSRWEVDVSDKQVNEGRHAQEAADGRSRPISG